MDLLGPDIFCTLWMKEQVLHRERAHLKVPDWSLVWSVLLTKRLPMFLSRLNEISGGYEKIVPVSESFWSNLKFLRMIDLTAWLWGWNVRVNGMQSVFSFSAHLNDRNRIATFIEKLAQTENLSPHYINDEVWETVKKVWSFWRVMDVKMNTTSNYVNL